MANAVQNKTQYIASRYLNAVDDSAAGGGPANIAGASRAPGQLGSVVYIGPNDPLIYDSSVGTLYPGTYQYVHLVSTSTAAAAVGGIAYWVDPTSSTVPYDVTADATDGNQAGVFINVLTKGNYGFIQVDGLANVLFASSTTKATPAIKDLVVCSSGAGTADVLADATSLTSPLLKRVLGTAEAAPTGGSVSAVMLQFGKRNQ